MGISIFHGGGGPGTTIISANTSVPAGNTIASANTETLFASNYVIVAGTLIAGNVIRVTARGVYGTNGITDSLTLKVKFSTTVIGATAAITPALGLTNQAFMIEFNIIVDTIGAGGTVEGQGYAALSTAAATASVAAMSNTATIAIDTTASQTVQLSATFNNSSAANTITLRSLVIEIM